MFRHGSSGGCGRSGSACNCGFGFSARAEPVHVKSAITKNGPGMQRQLIRDFIVILLAEFMGRALSNRQTAATISNRSGLWPVDPAFRPSAPSARGAAQRCDFKETNG